jgi:nudix motif 8
LERFAGSVQFDGKAFQKKVFTKSGIGKERRKQRVTEEAAVLIPFCLDEQNRASILFTLRSAQLSTHKYEVCFPGGKLCPHQDNNDLMATAVRETVEEIGLPDKCIQVIGKLPPFPSKSSIVHPVLALINLIDHRRQTDFQLSDEVEEVTLVPLHKLLDQQYWFHTHWKEGYSTPVFKDDTFDDRQRPRIWGLTAFFLHLVLQNLAPEQFKVQYPTISRLPKE